MPLEILETAGRWSNDNQGILSIAIFLVTLLFGWVSGIFSAIRRKPKFAISIIKGPTFCCTFPVGKQHQGYNVHRTAIALYLQICNIGSAPSDIENISVGYHWNLRPLSVKWLRYSVGWFWLNTQAISLTDFFVKIGSSTKVFPFLTQTNAMSPVTKTTFLDVGRAINGVVYFEQEDSWGGCFPISRQGRVRVKVRVADVFGHKHTAKFSIPMVTLEQARKYNPSFGRTFAELRGEELPFDIEVQAGVPESSV